jgi:hypothetical protein
MGYSYRDYYSGKRPVQTDPSMATGQWPIGTGSMLAPGSRPTANDTPPLIFGGRPGQQSFQNSFGKPGYGNDAIDFGQQQVFGGVMGPQASSPATMPPPTFNPQPQRKNVYTGLPNFGGGQNGAGSDPFAFLMNAMGGGMMGGMQTPGVTKVPQGMDPRQYVHLSREQKLAISQAGPAPGEGFNLEWVPTKGWSQNGMGGSWQWKIRPRTGNH